MISCLWPKFKQDNILYRQVLAVANLLHSWKNFWCRKELWSQEKVQQRRTNFFHKLHQHRLEKTRLKIISLCKATRLQGCLEKGNYWIFNSNCHLWGFLQYLIFQCFNLCFLHCFDSYNFWLFKDYQFAKVAKSQALQKIAK